MFKLFGKKYYTEQEWLVCDTSDINDVFCKNSDFTVSLDSYIERTDKKLEEEYLQGRDNGRFDDFDIALDIVSRAVIFGYTGRHLTDESDLSAFVIDFYKKHKAEIDKLQICSRPEYDWFKRSSSHFCFNPYDTRGSFTWAKDDPRTLFCYVVCGIQDGDIDARVVRLCDDDHFEFISESHRLFSRRCCSKLGFKLDYKNLLDELQEITKDWVSRYSDCRVMDGSSVDIYCPDLNLDTHLLNGYPANYKDFLNCMAKRFLNDFYY